MLNISSRMQLDEKLDWISAGQTLDEQVDRARQMAQLDVTFPVLMRMACLESERLVGLPVGMPDSYKPVTDMPEGISHTNARQEFRRIKLFLANGTMQKLSPAKREMQWTQLMEGMHWKEANVMICIKDQTLFEFYPNMRDVLIKLGVQIQPVAPKAEAVAAPELTESVATPEAPKVKKARKVKPIAA